MTPDGTEEQIPDGKSVRQPGSHTEIRPKDPDKIRVWLMALDWCHQKRCGC